MNNDLAAALTALIASAAPAAAPTTVEQDFAALLAGTTPQPAPTVPVRCPVTGGIAAFVHTAAEVEAAARYFRAA